MNVTEIAPAIYCTFAPSSLSRSTCSQVLYQCFQIQQISPHYCGEVWMKKFDSSVWKHWMALTIGNHQGTKILKHRMSCFLIGLYYCVLLSNMLHIRGVPNVQMISSSIWFIYYHIYGDPSRNKNLRQWDTFSGCCCLWGHIAPVRMAYLSVSIA